MVFTVIFIEEKRYFSFQMNINISYLRKIFKKKTRLVLVSYVSPLFTSDSWLGYKTTNMEEAGIQHFKVNHRNNFVDADNRVHAQNIKPLWESAKLRNKRHGRTASPSWNLPGGVQEFTPLGTQQARRFLTSWTHGNWRFDSDVAVSLKFKLFEFPQRKKM